MSPDRSRSAALLNVCHNMTYIHAHYAFLCTDGTVSCPFDLNRTRLFVRHCSPLIVHLSSFASWACVLALSLLPILLASSDHVIQTPLLVHHLANHASPNVFTHIYQTATVYIPRSTQRTGGREKRLNLPFPSRKITTLYSLFCPPFPSLGAIFAHYPPASNFDNVMLCSTIRKSRHLRTCI